MAVAAASRPHKSLGGPRRDPALDHVRMYRAAGILQSPAANWPFQSDFVNAPRRASPGMRTSPVELHGEPGSLAHRLLRAPRLPTSNLDFAPEIVGPPASLIGRRAPRGIRSSLNGNSGTSRISRRHLPNPLNERHPRSLTASTGTVLVAINRGRMLIRTAPSTPAPPRAARCPARGSTAQSGCQSHWR